MPTIDDYAPLQAGFHIFVKKHQFQELIWKKEKYHDQKSTRTWFSIYPTISVKMLKKKSTFILKLNPACNGSLISIISDATESTFRKELYCMVISKSK